MTELDAGGSTGGRPPLISVGLVSGAALGYEILLMRLFSIIQWHHTAYMIISLALLGYAASGSLLTWRGEQLGKRFDRAYPMALLLGGVAMVVCFLGAQRIAVHPEELLWAPRQIGALMLVYLLLSLPFFFIACAVGLTLMRYRAQRVYASDLLGAGAGGAGALLLLYLLQPMDVLRTVASLVLLAVWIGGLELGTEFRRLRWAPAVLIAMVWLLPSGWSELEISPYKGLSQALRIKGAYVASERSSPLAFVSVVDSPEVPLRHAPGLSLAARRGPPAQIGLFLDGGTLMVINEATGDRAALDHLDYSTAALPYHLARPRSVLVLGAGGGEQVLRAQLQGARRVVGVEIDPQVVAVVRDDYAEFSGRIYERPGVEIRVAEVRGFVARESRRFDLVEHVALGGLGGGPPGLHALAESYLYTVEAMEAYLERVTPGGLLAMTGWVQAPPRPTVKLVATVLEALRRRGVESPAERLVVVRSWQTSTLVVKNGAFEETELRRLREFCRTRFFDLVFYPGMESSEANRYNRMAEADLHQAVLALLSPQRESFLARSKFDLAPATDDRPFFHQFFRWHSLVEILSLRGRGGLPLLEASYLILVVTLVQGAIAGALLIALTAWLLRRSMARRGIGRHRPSRARVFFYFSGLGLGFLLLEVSLLQKFILFLHHPVISAAVVLTSFLAFAGLGSMASGRLAAGDGCRLARVALLLVGAFGGACLVAVHLGGAWLAGAAAFPRVAAAIGLIAPLAFVMGMPFPLGLQALKHRAPDLVPWAWAVNGCASVVSPVLATLLAVHLGFTAVILMALVIYLASALAFPGAAVSVPARGT